MDQLTGRVQPEVKQQWQAAFELSGANTFNQFVEIILEAYLNPKTKTVEVPRPTTEQENEIGRLKTGHTLELEALQNRITELETLTAELETLNSELETVNAARVDQQQAGENQVIVDLPPVIALVLDQEAATAAKKAGKTFTRADILKNCFWETIKDGRFVPYKIWSDTELRTAIKQVQTAQPAPQS